MRYDIGIYGLWYGHNYGSQLTYYALRHTLRAMGNSVIMIENPLGQNTYEMEHQDETGPYGFAKRHEYAVSELLPLDQMYKLNAICSKFVIGSDQMWNYVLSRSYKQTYFLDFVQDEKIKISYATSFGKMKYGGSEKDRELTIKNLERFSALSVRDDFSKEILEYDFHIPATRVLDPVFLCDRSVYENLLVELPEEYQGDFIFAYILDPNKVIGRVIQNIAEKTDMRVVIVLDLGGNKEEQIKKLELSNPNVAVWNKPTAEQWLTCIKKSRFVLTDSYHGTIFSTIFRKPFVVKKNLNRGTRRFDDLIHTLSLENYMVKNAVELGKKFDELGLDHQIDYEVVEKLLAKERDRSYQWLKKALEPDRIEQNAVMAVLNRKMCTGCSACYNACPVHAITMEKDLFGYYRSQVDHKKCVGCGKCVQVCPALKLPEKKNDEMPDCYEFIAAETDVLESSTSGGIFTLLSRQILKKKGYVVGAAWTEDISVRHIMTDQESELGKLRKSKYVQSFMGDIFSDIKEKLDARKQVLFSGCPCQVAGLKKYLQKEYKNLLLVDVLCGNAPSSDFFRKYLEDEFPEGVASYQFRNKKFGWNSDCVEVILEDGSIVTRRGSKQDYYQRVYHSHVMCPPHCEHCRYQETPRFGDITIGDFWGISQIDPQVDTKNGVSVVLCNNSKGKAFMEAISASETGWKKKVPATWIGGNGFAFNNHNWISPQRDAFYDAILKMPFRKAVNCALKPNHGEYRDIYDMSPVCLQYETKSLRFHMETDIWEEHYIDGKTFLFVKIPRAGTGHYATMALYKCLKNDREYDFKIRFRIRSKSEILNFHVKDSGSALQQVIYSCDIHGKNDGTKYIEVDTVFTPETDFYDEFMVGASQISGKGNFLEIEYIYISEHENYE